MNFLEAIKNKNNNKGDNKLLVSTMPPKPLFPSNIKEAFEMCNEKYFNKYSSDKYSFELFVRYYNITCDNYNNEKILRVIMKQMIYQVTFKLRYEYQQADLYHEEYERYYQHLKKNFHKIYTVAKNMNYNECCEIYEKHKWSFGLGYTELKR